MKVKKLFMFMLAICLMVPAMFMLTACGNGNAGGDGDGENEVTLQYTAASVDQQLQDMETTGYSISMVMSGTENGSPYSYTLKLESKGDVYHFQDDETNIWYNFTDTTYDIYTVSDSVWEKNSIDYALMETTKLQAKESMRELTSSYMNYFSIYTTYSLLPDAGFVKGDASTIAGITCVKYTYNYSVVGVGSVTYSYYINEYTGMCLKMTASGSFEGVDTTVAFECTEFNTTNVNLSLPTVGSNANVQ